MDVLASHFLYGNLDFLNDALARSLREQKSLLETSVRNEMNFAKVMLELIFSPFVLSAGQKVCEGSAGALR